MAHIRMTSLIIESLDKLADRVRDAADKMMRSFERRYTKTKDPDMYKEMLAMGKADKKDLYKIATEIGKGRLDLASKLAFDMDTAARNIIPDSVMNFF